jgi:acetylornithine deacetylase/succinyl-diaminopimelate desuccinylase-like protein
MDHAAALRHVRTLWEGEVVGVLSDFLRIPNKSPAFAPDWRELGHMERAVELVAQWCRGRKLDGLKVEIVRIDGRTPLLFLEIPGTAPGTVLMYGHVDKQPEMEGWSDGRSPWEPVLRDGRLYGRGGADDGYAAFAALTALEVVQAQSLPHARCVVVIEASEESGSPDLAAYVDHLSDRIGRPDLVVCLDSGCGNYDQLWCTTSLRGLLVGDLRVDVLTEGVHSGDASGIVPSSFRIVRQLVDRIEDAATGEIRLSELHVAIPPEREAEADVAHRALAGMETDCFPWAGGTRPVTNGAEAILARTWKPALAVTAAAGLPALADGGNVLRPHTAVRLSVRLPPTCDAARARAALQRALLTDPPYGATVTLDSSKCSTGWDAPPLADWLRVATDEASRKAFGREAVWMGEGGSIPFMGMLGERFPEAQFLITGVLGPGSNAHGPNEFLDLATAHRVTVSVAHVLAAHARPR